MVFQLIYISQATELMDLDQLQDILYSSRRYNRIRNITGMLVYVEGQFITQVKRTLVSKPEGRFIQILEGQESDVRELYTHVEADFRHYNLVTLKEGFSNERNFDDWEMGFRSLSMSQVQSVYGFVDLEQKLSKICNLGAMNEPLLFLSSFYQMSKSKV